MGTAKLVSAPPFLIFGAAVFAFGGWIACESVRAPAKSQTAARPAVTDSDDPIAPPADVVLGMVHLGAPRPHVERALAAIPPDVEPVDLSSGAPVLRSRYRVALTRFVPHLMRGTHPFEFRPGLYVLTLEFDGRIPGHPLTRAELTPVTSN